MVEELDFTGREKQMDTIISLARTASLYKVPQDGIAKVICDIFPISYENARGIIMQANSWGLKNWGTPDWDAARWFHQSIHDEDKYQGSKGGDQEYVTELWRTSGHSEIFYGEETIRDTIIETYIRSLMYMGVASVFGYNYAPDSIRVPIVGYVDRLLKQRMNQIFLLLMKRIEDTQEETKIRNEWIGRSFDIDAPAALGMVIKSCKRKQDFLNSAMTLRESEKVTNFRALLTEPSQMLRSWQDQEPWIYRRFLLYFRVLPKRSI